MYIRSQIATAVPRLQVSLILLAFVAVFFKTHLAEAGRGGKTPTSLNAPLGVAAIAESSSSIRISFLDTNTSEKAYAVERSLSSLSGFVEIIRLSADVISYLDVSVSPETKYYYRIRALGSRNTFSAYSATVSAITPAAPPPPPPSDDPVEPPVTCSKSISSLTRVLPIDISPNTVRNSTGLGPDPVVSDGTPEGGTALAWSATTGEVVLTVLNSSGVRAIPDVKVIGTRALALEVTNDGYVLLVGRTHPSLSPGFPGIIAFVRISSSGSVVVNKNILGDCDITLQSCDYLSATVTSLLWTGTRYAAYFGIIHDYGSSGRHQTETLRYYDLNGNLVETGWATGLGHSITNLLSLNANGLGTSSYSDCYPSKAIYFKGSVSLVPDPAGGCAGVPLLKLGGMAPAADGFWLNYVVPQSTSSNLKSVGLMKVSNSGAILAKSWSTTATTYTNSALAADLVPYGSGFLTRWMSTDSDATVNSLLNFIRHDASGLPQGPSEMLVDPLPGTFNDNRMFSYPNGDVGWIKTSKDAKGLYLYRVQAGCQ